MRANTPGNSERTEFYYETFDLVFFHYGLWSFPGIR